MWIQNGTLIKPEENKSALGMIERSKARQNGDYRINVDTVTMMISSEELKRLENNDELSVLVVKDCRGDEPYFNQGLIGNEFDNDFTNWLDTLDDLGHAKWTLATIFLFAIFPDKYMFVKPDTTRTAAEIANFYINYNSTPTIDTYNRILSFSRFLFLQIEELKPTDMIDVQGFMWCIKPETVELIKKYQDDEAGYWKK